MESLRREYAGKDLTEQEVHNAIEKMNDASFEVIRARLQQEHNEIKRAKKNPSTDGYNGGTAMDKMRLSTIDYMLKHLDGVKERFNTALKNEIKLQDGERATMKREDFEATINFAKQLLDESIDATSSDAMHEHLTSIDPTSKEPASQQFKRNVGISLRAIGF